MGGALVSTLVERRRGVRGDDEAEGEAEGGTLNEYGPDGMRGLELRELTADKMTNGGGEHETSPSLTPAPAGSAVGASAKGLAQQIPQL